MKEAIKDLKVWKLLLFPFIVYSLRGLAVMMFINEQGSLTLIIPEGGGLPANVDYFFSTILFVVTFSMLFFTKLLFAQSSVGNYMKKGITIVIFFIGQFFLWDILVEMIIYNRAFLNYITVVFIDYSPVIFIPLFIGIILKKEYAKILAK